MHLKELALSNTSILALSWHVDYWNYLGFPDPYANAAFTVRQRSYSSAMHRTNIFTPELIIQGAISVVGCDVRKVCQAIQSARSTQLQIEMIKSGSNVTVKVQSLLPAVNCDVLLLYLQRYGLTRLLPVNVVARRLKVSTSFMLRPQQFRPWTPHMEPAL